MIFHSQEKRQPNRKIDEDITKQFSEKQIHTASDSNGNTN